MVIACAAILGACGGEDEPAAEEVAPAGTATATPTVRPGAETSASPTRAPTLTATPTPTIPPAEEDAGDEGGNRVELHFDLFVEDVAPRELDVPAFLGLRIRLRNQSGSERIVRIDGEPVLELLPGESQTAEVEGLRPGPHILDAGESGRAVLNAERAG